MPNAPPSNSPVALANVIGGASPMLLLLGLRATLQTTNIH